MALLVFLIMLSVLVIVHELGHFVVARMSNIRVEEFGLGYPPKAKSLFRFRGTEFSLNWLPFGGFVRIFGENYDSEEKEASSFQHKNKGIQASVLAAGSFFNLLFAWLILSLGFMIGLPASTGLDFPVEHVQTVVSMVLPGSPAEQAGLKPGDALISLQTDNESLPHEATNLSPEAVSRFIGESQGILALTFKRGSETETVHVTPVPGIVPHQRAVGISMALLGTAKLSPFKALKEGGRLTWSLTKETVSGLKDFIVQAFRGKSVLTTVTGPVGLVSLVGDAQKLGLGYLLTFTALISINLAIINLLPFPALDGGRIVFVLLEALSRKRVPPRIFNMINTIGFALLIFLMILVTIHDIKVIFS